MNRRWIHEVESLGPTAQHEGDYAALLLMHFAEHGKSAVVRFDKENTNFPFKPINVSVASHDFRELVGSLHSDPTAVRLTREVIKSECIVCDSILCKNKWNCQNTLVMVRNEVRRGLGLKLRYSDRLLLWMLAGRLKTLPKDVFWEVEKFL